MTPYSNKRTFASSVIMGLLTLLMFTTPNPTLAQDGTAPVTAGWPTYSSPDLHISFAYPPNWQLNIPTLNPIVVPADLPKEYQPPKEGPSQGYGGVLALSPPKGHVLEGNRIEITVQSYEIPEGQDLFSWVAEMQALSSLIHPYEGTSQTWIRDITSRELRNKENMEQVLHAVTEVEGYGPTTQAVWFTHGRLVYVINSFAYSDDMQVILDALASSIEFAPDAPRTLNELYKAEQEWPSLRETLDNFRAPHNLVEECDIVCRDAKAAKEIQPDPIPILDRGIEKEERRRCEQSKAHEQNEIEQSTSVQGMIQRPLPLPQPTVSRPTATPSFVTHRGKSLYPDSPLFEFTYDEAIWQIVGDNEFREHALLIQRKDLSCYLVFPEGAREYWNIGPLRLAGQPWMLRFFPPDYLIYDTEIDGHTYIVGLHLPEDYHQGQHSDCQKLAESILATIRMINDKRR